MDKGEQGELTGGVRGLLAAPRFYDLLQTLLGEARGRTLFSSGYVRARQGERVLDIGCGTAAMRLYLPDIDYVGFDPNPAYIETARERCRGRGRSLLLCAKVGESPIGDLPPFDVAIAVGVLHHLTDAEALSLAQLARDALKPGGRLVTLDPCYDKSQSRIARFLIGRDRGRNVRDRDGYGALLGQVFDKPLLTVRHDMLRIPYTHLIMEARVP